ncbi:MAG: ribonuclease P protein component [Alphaproteobacteria bacterium]|nr:ribonuclease P protein component [Alphaproteobacteria bacterium]
MPAQSLALRRLKRRRDFLKVAGSGDKRVTAGLVLQQRRRSADERAGNGDSTIRVGFTASRRVGNAVQRNRARRRLKALAGEVLPELGRPGFDYVLIARAATASRPFAALTQDLRRALDRTGSAPSNPSGRS